MIEFAISVGKLLFPRNVKMEIAKKLHPWWRPSNIRDSSLRLHLGCGANYFPGYINVDLPVEFHVEGYACQPDMFADARALPFWKESVTEIQAHHIVEHFDRPGVLRLLIHWYELLEPGGEIVISTPNLVKAAKRSDKWWISDRERMLAIRHIFGSQDVTWAYHLDGWSKWKWKLLLPLLGFEHFRFREYTSNRMDHLIVRARKARTPVSLGQLLQNSIAFLEMSGSDSEDSAVESWVNQLVEGSSQGIMNSKRYYKS